MVWVKLGLAVILVVAASLAVLVSCSSTFNARAYSALQGDNKPYSPFEIADGLYYVGANGVSSYALETDIGLILIDGGYAETAPIILSNLAELGFAPTDVTLLLNSHGHMDHAAGLAPLKEATGASLAATPESAAELARGGRDDFYLGDYMAFASVTADILLSDGDALDWGGRAITPISTPGHTRGCTSWAFEVSVQGETRSALLICSLSILQYPLVDNKKWPGIAGAFQKTFDTLERQPCEVFLTVHGRLMDLDGKKSRIGGDPSAFIDPEGCRSYIAYARDRFEDRLASQME